MIRRDFIKNIGLLTPAVSFSTPFMFSSCKAKQDLSFRVVHLTDCHVSESSKSIKGLEMALKEINRLNPKPAFILNGGDAIFDALRESKNKTQQQWDVWHSVLRANNSLPIHSCIGNHDIWKWELIKNKHDKDVFFGKEWAAKELNLPERYYSFDYNNWHFVVLDSMQFKPKGFVAKIDEEQWQWLTNELKASENKPTCILSHAPLASFCHQLFLVDENNRETVDLPKGVLMHADSLRVKNIFKNHPNVKLCLSGHLHMREEVNYLGVKYLCNGALCGNWWKGSFHEFKPSYTIIDFFQDGSTQHQWVAY